jgi:hypothetical protein
MGADVGHFVDLGHLTFRIDQVGDALGEVRVLRVGAALDAIGPASRTIGVGQQVEPELLLVGEGFVLGGGIEAGT